jgi:calcineurin-like phosphoesterase
VIKAFRTQMPYPLEIATEDVRLSAIEVVVDSQSRRAEHIERIQLRLEESEATAYDSDDGKPDYHNNGF